MITVQEAKKAMDELKAQRNVTDEDLLGMLYLMFQDDKITFDELEALVDSLGYQITEEFRNMSPEDQKTKGYTEVDEEDAEGLSDKEIEQGKEMGEESDKDGDKPSEENQGQDKEEGKQPDQSDSKEPGKEDDDELKEARKLYGFDK